MLSRTPDPLDVMVGAKIRIFRIYRGMSQSDLAGKIGVAFQQVQKYEKGINRAGAGRLSRIAGVLGVSIGELFGSPEKQSAGSQTPLGLLADRDALRVLKAFARTSDPRVRRSIAMLVESIADQQSAAKPSTVRPAVTKLRPRRRRTSVKRA
jgi:transcriptional regulator with XRE-family HTH domain